MARARSFGSIRKLPSGKYQARYWHLGKQISAEHTYANETDARRWLARRTLRQPVRIKGARERLLFEVAVDGLFMYR